MYFRAISAIDHAPFNHNPICKRDIFPTRSLSGPGPCLPNNTGTGVQPSRPKAVTCTLTAWQAHQKPLLFSTNAWISSTLSTVVGIWATDVRRLIFWLETPGPGEFIVRMRRWWHSIPIIRVLPLSTSFSTASQVLSYGSRQGYVHNRLSCKVSV